MLYILFYISLISIASILRREVGINMPQMLLIFLATSTAIMVFSLLCLPTLKDTYKFMFKYKTYYLLISLWILIMWVGSFINPIYFSPSTHLFTFMIIPSVLGSFSSYRKNHRPIELIRSIIFFILLITFYYLLFAKYNTTHIKYVLMISSTFITGISTFAYFKFSEKFNQQNIKPLEILAVRFWGLWLVSLFIVLYNHEFTNFKLSYACNGVFIGLISLVIPIYFLQKSIAKIGANISSIYMGAAPFFCFLLEKYAFNIHFGIEFLCSIIYLIMLFAFSRVTNYHNNSKIKPSMLQNDHR